MNKGTKGATLVVVVGIDFSPVSSELLSDAAEIAGRDSGELHVVHVVARAPSESTANLSADRDEVATHVEGPRAALERMVKQVDGLVLRTALHVRTGRPDVEIVQLANDVNADVIVVATHGRTGLKRLLLGSVARTSEAFQ